MNIPGLVQSYDSRTASSTESPRTIMAPHYVQQHVFTGASPAPLVVPHQAHPQVHQPHPFDYVPFTSAETSNLITPFAANYVQQRPQPLPRMLPQGHEQLRRIPFSQSPRQGYAEDIHSRSPPIKAEPVWHASANLPSSVATSPNPISITSPTTSGPEASFGTEVDTLMKAIQAKSQLSQEQAISPIEQKGSALMVARTSPIHTVTPTGAYPTMEPSDFRMTQPGHSEEPCSPKGAKKRYQCTIEDCTKSFYQKTHLDIHERAHTGVKPYPCKEPGCGRSFSQLGNLKTHERRHTGERPYQCDICHKRFAQRGNVRAHKIVHDQFKPYLCRLDDCGKQFTQLGNLKSHQNKFHIATIRALTTKFASIKDTDLVDGADRELWEYFANLYKNSNKGIKGRGKDRKVGPNSSSSSHSMRSSDGVFLPRGNAGGYGMNSHGLGRGNIARSDGGSQYDMFDVDDGSQAGSVSTAGTVYDDAPSDGFEDAGRGVGVDLAFGERIY